MQVECKELYASGPGLCMGHYCKSLNKAFGVCQSAAGLDHCALRGAQEGVSSFGHRS